MSKHTPGPWTYGHDGHGGISVETDDCDGVQIAFVRRAQEDNARLIAAAPELLLALENLLAFVEGECGSIAEDDCNVLAAHAAIAKATGEA